MIPKHIIESANVTSHGKREWLATRRLRISESCFDMFGFERGMAPGGACQPTRSALEEPAKIAIKVNWQEDRWAGSAVTGAFQLLK
jgi:hypothetical protein